MMFLSWLYFKLLKNHWFLCTLFYVYLSRHQVCYSYFFCFYPHVLTPFSFFLEFDALTGSKISSIDIGSPVVRMSYSPTSGHALISILEVSLFTITVNFFLNLFCLASMNFFFYKYKPSLAELLHFWLGLQSTFTWLSWICLF